MSDYALKNASSKEIRKAVKRLNERLADMERKQFTETALYSEITKFAETVSGGRFYSKSGHTKIKVDVRKLNDAQLRKLSRLSSQYFTLGRELNRQAQKYQNKDYGKLSPEGRADLKAILKVGNDFHKYLENVNPTIYDIDQVGNIIKGNVRGGNNDGDVSYTKQAQFLEMVEDPQNWIDDIFMPWKRKNLKKAIKEPTKREYLRVYDYYNQPREEPLTDWQLDLMGL